MCNQCNESLSKWLRNVFDRPTYETQMPVELHSWTIALRMWSNAWIKKQYKYFAAIDLRFTAIHAVPTLTLGHDTRTRSKSPDYFTICCSLFNNFRSPNAIPLHLKIPSDGQRALCLVHCWACSLSDGSLVDYSYPLGLLKGDQALWFKAGTNVRKWFRLLRFSFFFPCVWRISWKKTVTEP